MRSELCSHTLVLITNLILLVAICIVLPSSSAEEMADLTASNARSSSGDTFTSTRHKRAPGWGKRNFGSDELLDESENGVEERKNNDAFRAAVFLSQDAPITSGKRAPGWGKRAPGWGKRAPGWGKRSCDEDGCYNRADIFPHLGKVINDDTAVNDDDGETEHISRVLFKRAPGWGKRSYDIDLDNDDAQKNNKLRFLSTNDGAQVELLENIDNVREMLNRIAAMSRATLSSQNTIFTDKRAPGWGKRSHRFDFNDEVGKRAPGWGKRAPGWGKRNDQIELDDEFSDSDKRAPGWGKRAPGWGKRSVPDDCQNMNDDGVSKVVKGVSGKCGNPADGNKPSRK